jgi:phosphatidylethanolamine-binding protein (PEBP) family uncharacterized protein
MAKTGMYSILAAVASLAAATDARAMDARFAWSGIPRCSRVSPAFTMHGVPAGTASLRFALRDEDRPGSNHGGATIPYAGPSVPRGAVDHRGPCPPEGQMHLYFWTVDAIDAVGNVLATASASGRFPPN